MTAPLPMQVKLRIEEFTPDHFVAQQGSIFLFQPPARPDGTSAEPVALALVEVTAHRKQEGARSRLRREPFSLLFRSARRQTLTPVLHTMIHDTCEPCLIFVSRIQPPAGVDPSEVFYEAVFN